MTTITAALSLLLLPYQQTIPASVSKLAGEQLAIVAAIRPLGSLTRDLNAGKTAYSFKSAGHIAIFSPTGKLIALQDTSEIDPADIQRPPLTEKMLLDRAQAAVQKLGYKDYVLTVDPPKAEVQGPLQGIRPTFKEFYFNYFPKGVDFIFDPLSIGFHYECMTGKIIQFGQPADYTFKSTGKSITEAEAKSLAGKYFADHQQPEITKTYGFGFLSPNEYFGGPPELKGSKRFLISAYVFANPEDKIFVDATTGKIVGGEHERKSHIGARLPYPKIEAFDGTPATKIEED